jgi:hypothetical protein
MPTRERPLNIYRLWQSILETADDVSNIEMILYIDEDDHSYDNLEVPFIKVSGERIILSEMWNKCYEKASGDILMHCGDDIIFRTKGWDTIVSNKFKEYPDNIAFVYGNDGSNFNGVFGTHGFIHKDWVEAIGYFVPPYFVSDYNDTWLNDVAKMIGRHIHVDILTEHMHYLFGKAVIDKNTLDRLDRHNQNGGVASLYSSLEMQKKRISDAEKLKEKMLKNVGN